MQAPAMSVKQAHAMPLITDWVSYGPHIGPRVVSAATTTNHYHMSATQIDLKETDFKNFFGDGSEIVSTATKISYGIICAVPTVKVPSGFAHVVCILPIPEGNLKCTISRPKPKDKTEDEEDESTQTNDQIEYEYETKIVDDKKFLNKPVVKQAFRRFINSEKKRYCNLVKMIYEDSQIKKIYLHKNGYWVNTIRQEKEPLKIGAIALCVWSSDTEYFTPQNVWINYGLIKVGGEGLGERKLKYFSPEEYEAAFDACRNIIKQNKVTMEQRLKGGLFGERNANKSLSEILKV